ncbi:hypothetical protein KC19_VG019500 [Ceratodon purpureus]|uniref:Uncharacterized protein n=1 Tax=Ceratodon purpureus TaxID=3225 RepID=A0A8T0HL62_CERPU|nr:hypothetical protein KC19_VG019500 [Ceratodon purpureus]
MFIGFATSLWTASCITHSRVANGTWVEASTRFTALGIWGRGAKSSRAGDTQHRNQVEEETTRRQRSVGRDPSGTPMDVLDEYKKLLGDNVWMLSSGECPESLLKEMEHIWVPPSPGVPVGNTQRRHISNAADVLHLISSEEDMDVRSRKLYRSKRRRR